jgi:hypothetical protein
MARFALVNLKAFRTEPINFLPPSTFQITHSTQKWPEPRSNASLKVSSFNLRPPSLTPFHGSFVNDCLHLGALPTGKIKQRKTSNSNAQDALSSDEDEMQSGHELFVQEQPVAAKHVKKGSPKSRKSEPTRPYRDNEYEDDPGRTESQ